MKSFKWLLITTSFLALMLNNLALVNGENGGGDDGDSEVDSDGDDHHDGGSHIGLGIGGYYDPWLWGGYGYYNPGFWGNYYSPGFYGPYGYRAYDYADPFFRPYYAYPPAVVAPSRPPVYIQQQEPKTTQLKTNYWHYCKNPKGYYPYVRECLGGWLQIAPQPSVQ